MIVSIFQKYLHSLSISKLNVVSVFITLGGITALVIAICAPILFWAETGAEEANIKSWEDALWLSFMIVTTIGFGDFYPITGIGRLVAIPLAATGIGVFGTLAGYIGSIVLDKVVRQATTDMLHQQNERIEGLAKQNNELNAHIKDIASENKKLNRLIVELSQNNQDLNEKIGRDTDEILKALKER
ncbi:potassium channel family protein [Terasakiella sp. SH-1]|uniref:potassium channel family protein n=1 Tax=Terasakiella sp. SH-1 TaxID=2560057 RepID=UPI001072F761|nr:potassium channel family protein [Terasakiella sp. SH-1]